MSQYRRYTTDVFISDANIIVTSTFGPNTLSNTIVRDGSMDANFKTALAAHRDSVLSLKPSSTSPACYLVTVGKWVKSTNSGTVVSDNATIKVPTGNSGVLVLHLDATSYVTKWSKNGGAFTTFVDGATVTVADGDTLKFEGLALVAQDFVNGTVTDQDTGVQLDAFSLFNSTPA